MRMIVRFILLSGVVFLCSGVIASSAVAGRSCDDRTEMDHEIVLLMAIVNNILEGVEAR